LNAEYDRNRRSLRPPHPHHAQMTDQAKSLLMYRIFPDPLSVNQRESIGDLHQMVPGKCRTHRWFRSLWAAVRIRTLHVVTKSCRSHCWCLGCGRRE
jgi:hypothetical protein